MCIRDRNNCLRFEVSPSVEESAGMTEADWAKLGNDFMQRMGSMNHQYICLLYTSHRHELFGCTGEEMVQEMKPYFLPLKG